MTSSVSGRRGLTALTVIAAAAFYFLCLAQSHAVAADKTTGNATFTIKSGKAGKVAAIKPAKVAKRFGKGAKVTSSAKNANFASKASSGLAGGLRFSNGKRKVEITGLSVKITGNKTVVRGKLGGKTVNVFNAKGKSNVDLAGKTAKVSGAKLSLTGGAASKIRKSLKLKKAPKGNLGTFAVNFKVTSETPVDPCVANPDAQGCPIVDPYLAQCNVTATSKVPGSLTPASALPVLTGPVAVTGPAAVNWGFKTSFRNYLASPAANGSVHAIDGATATGSAPAYAGIDFPIVDGQYSTNGTTELTDDQAVVNTRGTLVLCGTGHNFRIAISDPTFVVDGANTRVIADVDTNLTGVWTPAQRVDLAKFNQLLGNVIQEPAGAGSSISASFAGTLTSTGADAICGTGEQAACNYTDVTPVDDLNLTLEVASAMPTADTYLAECGVPVAKVASGLWSSAANEPLPPLPNPVATDPTSITWGYKSSFRGYVNGTMFGSGDVALAQQALDGATETNPTEVPGPPPFPSNRFSFPVLEGFYDGRNVADPSDDQAILNGTGTGLFCNSVHGFWTSITDPTIVIDGSDSRIEATISQNTYGPGGTDPWQTAERVDLARLDLDEIDPVYSGSQVTWSNIPVIQLVDFSTYPAGTELDPITVSLETE